VAVLGVGNVLCGDDGFGPAVVALLRRMGVVDPRLELLDVGTPGLDLAEYLYGRELVVLLDAVVGPGAPGELHLLGEQDLAHLSRVQRRSAHDPSLLDALDRCRLQGAAPARLALVGVTPARLEPSLGLSEVVAASLPAAADLVLLELARAGLQLAGTPAEAPRPGNGPPPVNPPPRGARR